MQVRDVRKELQSLSDTKKAKIMRRFFKTGPGEYGEGDIFRGVTVPNSRKVARKFNQLELGEVKTLLYSGVHEERLVALLILVQKYAGASGFEGEKIVRFYLDNMKQVNNWDLVDLTAPNIIGSYLMNRERGLLYKLARSNSVWERRIAIIATLHFIRNNDFDDTLRIVEMLLSDSHDLIHKAAGWMLREVGKRDFAAQKVFLDKHYRVMPRTMLRYAIEKFPEKKRRYYMKATT
jgi:3-methyladenine DNA glycosylase AlkD